MNMATDARKAKMLGYGLTTCFLLIHVAMFLFFRYYGVAPMAYFNLFSVAFYLLSTLML